MSIVTRAGKGSALTHTEMDANLGYLVPAGFVMAYAHETIPSGWIECDGRAISRTTYLDLFNAISTHYGTGDGSSTFNIPDLRGQFIRGWDHGAGTDPDAASRTNRGDSTVGDNVGTKQADNYKNHQHQFGGDDQVQSQGGYTSLATFSYDATSGTSGSGQHMRTKNDSENTGTTETRPKNIQMPWCIKT